jgi:hypothetical protein
VEVTMVDILKDVSVDRIEKKLTKALSQLKKNVSCECMVRSLNFSGDIAKLEIEVTSQEFVPLSVVSPETSEKIDKIISDD